MKDEWSYPFCFNQYPVVPRRNSFTPNTTSVTYRGKRKKEINYSTAGKSPISNSEYFLEISLSRYWGNLESGQFLHQFLSLSFIIDDHWNSLTSVRPSLNWHPESHDFWDSPFLRHPNERDYPYAGHPKHFRDSLERDTQKQGAIGPTAVTFGQ